MLRRTLPLVAALAIVGAACGGPSVTVRSAPTRNVFVPQVVDFEGDVGGGVSLATDADGNPHLSYLAFEEAPEEGEAPAQQDPGPTLPAVKHAHLIQNLWTRSVVADDQQDVSEEDLTAIAVDDEGVHHVLWTAGGTLFYANNADGAEFSEPEEVASGVIGGLSAATAGGRVAVAFFQGGFGAEGPGSIVRVASRLGEAWEVETAAEAAAEEEPASALAFVGDTILVAFGDSGRTMVARSGETWVSEVADEDGGVGVSMTLDADGNPHLGYATSGGQVKVARSMGGGPWETNQVGEGAGGPTSIAVDDEGIRHLAWQTEEGISYANDQEEEFRAEDVPGSEGGAGPILGVGARGAAYLAWYDTEDSNLIMAVRSDREPLLAVPPPPERPTGPPTGPPPCEPDGTSLAIAAPPGAAGSGFAEDCLAAPAGEAFTIDFTNDDSGVPHNVGIYESQGGQPFFQGEIVTAPDQINYEVDPIDQAGQYFFQCDVHPTTMTGTFVVE